MQLQGKSREGNKMRRIIKIEGNKCNGCGLCADACHEGAIVIEDGKARLIGESYCDGLGDCLGECPQGAITFEMREAEPYDEAAVKERIARLRLKEEKKNLDRPLCGCPGTAMRQLKTPIVSYGSERQSSSGDGQLSQLANWPVQIKLVPVQAPYLEGAELLLAADCAAFSYPNFHRDLLPGRICLIGCPKLDEVEFYVEKISQLIRQNKTPRVDIAYMEVPCCGGLVKLVEKAVSLSGEPVELNLIKLSLDGRVLETIKTSTN